MRRPQRLLLTFVFGAASALMGGSSTRAAPPGVETLNALQRTVIPFRDRADLGRRLLGITSLPIAPHDVHEYRIGDEASFLVENGDARTLTTIYARMLYSTPHVYMWFQDGDSPDLKLVQATGDTFETKIYPTVHQYFGSEASPGVDGDQHIYILHAHGVGNAGYFASSSEYPRVLEPSSNEHEMFIVNLDTLGRLLGQPAYYAVLAHEFQHMVHFNTGSNGDAWLNEGLSELSAALCGYLDLGFAPYFMLQPATQLNDWPVDGQSTIPHYGAAYLFASYIFQRFGPDAIQGLMSDHANSLSTVRDVLRSLHASDPATGQLATLEDVFADWTVANLLDNPRIGDGRYGYAGIKSPLGQPSNLLIIPGATLQTLNASEWGTIYLNIADPGTFTFTFTSPPTVKIVTANPHSGSKMWWSGRADQSDTRLTHSFDLSQVQSATLSFWLWYATEDQWDYAYVEVSADGGQTWTTLATQDMVPPGHNNRFGPGFTGYSGHGKDRNSAAWRQESIDLTPYAGKRIQIRFEYLTDDEGTDDGVLVDDISIPEIRYSTDAEGGDEGWVAEGWTRIENVMPQP
ncbi:MAG TPA: hypothetical protein VMT34_12195, partial [Aggregatilineales bacterium]|nr:hypothetical protein [Aggregatilineales bacterium]